jgi:hypothetical protein
MAGDLAKFGAAVNRGKAGASSKAKKVSAMDKSLSTPKKRLPKTM